MLIFASGYSFGHNKIFDWNSWLGFGIITKAKLFLFSTCTHFREIPRYRLFINSSISSCKGVACSILFETLIASLL